jgi:catalase (peroxidase I)
MSPPPAGHFYYIFIANQVMANQITPEELQKLNFVKQDALEVASLLGELSYQKLSLEIEVEEQKKKIKQIKTRESEIFEELRSKYGNVSINIETGNIN